LRGPAHLASARARVRPIASKREVGGSYAVQKINYLNQTLLRVSKIAEQFAKAKRAFLDALFPIYCAGCRREGYWLCPDCTAAIRIMPLFLCPGCGRLSPGGMTHPRCSTLTPLSALVSPYHYANPSIRRLIKDYKYHGALPIERLLVGLTGNGARSLRTLFPQEAVIVPMPLYGSRERERGFNQAATLARALGQALSLKVAMPLSRIRRTEEQARLTSAERRENCQRAFACTPLAGDYILVDDVVTSGATMRAAAEALKKAGARRVTGFALAHGRGDRFET